MIQIAVNDVEAFAITESSTPVVIVDSHGKALGQIAPVDPEIAAQPGISAERWGEIKRRMQEPGEYVTYQEIRECLNRLEAV
ncbi:MAG: hypothetical protein WD851_04830 [Pirellulales bacterium]